MSDDQIVPMPNVALVKASEVPSLLALIRPQWQAKRLIDRVVFCCRRTQAARVSGF